MSNFANLTIAERIQQFTQKHPNVDQSLVPNLWITWTGKRKKNGNSTTYRKYYQINTGYLTEEKQDWISYTRNDIDICERWYSVKDDKIIVGHYATQRCTHNLLLLNAGNDCNYLYFKYDPELEVMEVCCVQVNTLRYNQKQSPEENVRAWVRDERYSQFFMIRGSKTPYDEKGNPKEVFSWPISPKNNSHIEEGTFKLFLKGLRRLKVSKRIVSQFEQFAADTLYGACGRALNPLYIYDIEDWFKRDANPKKGKVGLLIDELCNKYNNDLSHLGHNHPIIKSPLGYDDTKDIIYIDTETDKEWACLRVLARRNDNSVDESYRLFIHNNGKVVMARKIGPNKWTSSTDISKGWRGCKGQIVNYEAMHNHKRLAYIADIVSAFEQRDRLRAITRLIKYPIVEQIYKAGWKELARKALKGDSPMSILESYLGEINLHEKNLLAKFGLNKTQMDWVENRIIARQTTYSVITNSVSNVKALLKLSNISFLDNESFNELCCLVEKIHHSYVYNIAQSYGLPEEKNYTALQTIKFWLRMNRISAKYNAENPPKPNSYGFYSSSNINIVLTIFKDGLKLYKDMPADIRPDIDFMEMYSYSDISRFHDNMIVLFNANKQHIEDAKNKEKEAKMAKLDVKRKALFNYENDEYIIRLPNKLSEITTEGMVLSHCVGGYLDRHADGETTILFLRKKSEPDRPFYTIECRGTDPKNGIFVNQIHGHGNRWLGNNPEAVPFVMRWLRDKLIRCNDNILLSTAKSYGSYGAPLIAKPKI